jgi:alpha-L-rhamnosidase
LAGAGYTIVAIVITGIVFCESNTSASAPGGDLITAGQRGSALLQPNEVSIIGHQNGMQGKPLGINCIEANGDIKFPSHGTLFLQMRFFGLLPILLLPVISVGALTTVGDLRCEYRANPQGIDSPRPRLGWVVASDERGERQTAYRVLVASSLKLLAQDQGDRWDSGKVLSDKPVNLTYAGEALDSRQHCYWKVRVWNHAGKPTAWSSPADWSMGLLQPADWQAQWISDVVLANPANRPLTPIHCYRSTLATNAGTRKWITLDLGTNRTISEVDLLAARPAAENPDFRTMMFPERFKIEASRTADGSEAVTLVDQTDSDYASPRGQKCRFPFPAVAGRFVRLTVTQLSCWDGQDYGLALGGIQVYQGADSIGVNAQVDCSDSLETEAWSKRFLVDGKADVALAPDSVALAVDVPGVPASRTVSRVPMLRREFVLPGGIRSAALSVTARGCYEVRLNGQRVGDELLAPGYTSYSQRLQYQTYDVTKLLIDGKNALGALLGYGWYAGHMNLADNRCFDGTFPQFLAQLDVELADGRRLTIATDGDWRSTLSGPVRYSDLLDGEAYDCRLELPGWDRAGFDDAAWTKVWTQPRDDTPLVWQRCQPIRVAREFCPVASKQIKPEVYIFDLGQEITGWCRLRVKGQKGTHLTVRHAETIDPDGNLNTNNLWGVGQQEDYLLDDQSQRTLEPHFTYHGFRYVEVTGLPEPPGAETLTAVNFHSALPEAGEFLCSNVLYNRIMDAARWTQRNLLFDVPAGCAARSERVAWMGDVRPCVQAACFNFDAAGFLAKYAQDMRDAQTTDGRYCDITPHAHLRGTDICVGSAGWADCGVSLPWQEYVNYADNRALAEHYASARRWVDFVSARNPDFIWKNGRGMNDWGDWLSAGPASPKELGATAFFAHSADLVGRMASVLGQTNDAAAYRRLFEEIRKAFVKKYVSSDGVIAASPGSADGALAEGNYALALEFGLLDEPLKSRAATQLCSVITRAGGHPTIGFWSAAGLLLALSAYGHNAEAARMLGLASAPSWGYMVDHGTTLWEAFDADQKNLSLNHWTHSSVGEWLWRNIAGLNPDEQHPGYATFIIRPRPCGEVSWCQAQYRSLRGPIKISWQNQKQFTLDLTVPVTAMAVVYLPANAPTAVRESSRPARQAKGVQWLRQEEGESVFQVGSGTYHFTVD